MRSVTRTIGQPARPGRAGELPRIAWPACTLLAIAAGWAGSAGSCVEQDDEKPTQDDLKAIKANILAVAPTPRFAVNADLEGKVVYLGLDVEPAIIEPGKPAKLTHYWRAVSSPGDGWRVFTHLEGPKNQSFINADHGPVGGKYPVSQWKPGEIIKDEHTITLPASWAFDSVLVYSGLWRGPTRLAVKNGPSDGSNRVLAATIPVKVALKPDSGRKRYVVRKIDKDTRKALQIDGKLNEPAWAAAASTGPFVNTLNGGPVEQFTEAKMLWDDTALYVAFNVADTDVWSNLTKRDDKLWTQEAVELMIDADKNGKGYVEFQVAPNGNVFDTYLPEYRKYEDSIDPKRKPYSWNAKLTAAVVVEGTLNKHDDKDKGWTVELAIPLEDVKGMDTKAALPTLPPRPGDVWRINMFRMDQPEGKPQQASAWSPPLVGDFHALDRFGELVFGDEQGNIAASPRPAAMAVGAPKLSDSSNAFLRTARAKRKGAKHDHDSKPTP